MNGSNLTKEVKERGFQQQGHECCHCDRYMGLNRWQSQLKIHICIGFQSITFGVIHVLNKSAAIQNFPLELPSDLLTKICRPRNHSCLCTLLLLTKKNYDLD